MATCNQWTGSPSWLPICAFAQKWPETCAKDQCNNQAAWLPTRLRDLGTLGDQYVKLIEIRSTPMRAPYAQLSHTDSHIDHPSPNLFSQVTGGWIRVRGTVCPALLYPSDDRSRYLSYNFTLPQTSRQLYAVRDAEPKNSEFGAEPDLPG